MESLENSDMNISSFSNISEGKDSVVISDDDDDDSFLLSRKQKNLRREHARVIISDSDDSDQETQRQNFIRGKNYDFPSDESTESDRLKPRGGSRFVSEELDEEIEDSFNKIHISDSDESFDEESKKLLQVAGTPNSHAKNVSYQLCVAPETPDNPTRRCLRTSAEIIDFDDSKETLEQVPGKDVQINAASRNSGRSNKSKDGKTSVEIKKASVPSAGDFIGDGNVTVPTLFHSTPKQPAMVLKGLCSPMDVSSPRKASVSGTSNFSGDANIMVPTLSQSTPKEKCGMASHGLCSPMDVSSPNFSRIMVDNKVKPSSKEPLTVKDGKVSSAPELNKKQEQSGTSRPLTNEPEFRRPNPKDLVTLNDGHVLFGTEVNKRQQLSGPSSASTFGAAPEFKIQLHRDLQQQFHTSKPLVSTDQRGASSTFAVYPPKASQESSSNTFIRTRIETLIRELNLKEKVLACTNPEALPDKGLKLKKAIGEIKSELVRLEFTQKALQPVNRPSSVPQSKNAPLAVQDVLKKQGFNYPATENNFMKLGPAGQTSGHFKIQSVTTEALSRLHLSLKTCPPETQETEDPPGLVIKLLPHQRQALSWLLWREKQQPPSGILADDMGLGKTLTMISLVLKSKELEKENMLRAHKKEETVVKTSSTLVVCPASLMSQWQKEVESRCRYGRLRVLIFHGSTRTKSPSSLASYDIVLTTYQLLAREIIVMPKRKGKKKNGEEDKKEEERTEVEINRESVMMRVHWKRIILDEAHMIRNPKSQMSMAVCELRADHRWALTGTPIQNKELDMFALLRFLQCSPFDDIHVWKRWVDNKSAAGSQRLALVIRCLLLRRTKEQSGNAGPIVSLPPREMHDYKVQLRTQEQTVYDRVLDFSRAALLAFLQQHDSENPTRPSFKMQVGTGHQPPALAMLGKHASGADGSVKAHHLLVLLLRLRQICCHPGLIESMLEPEACASEGLTDSDGLDLDLLSRLGDMSLVDDDKEENIFTKANPIFNTSKTSSKLAALLDLLCRIKETAKSEKVVVVSQWTSMLKIVKEHLEKKGMRSLIISGEVPIKHRGQVMEDFNKNATGPKVLLLSLGAGGVGLNLIGGNHLVLLDLHWNPQLEAQACDRIYRVGQTKDVHIHKFICENTIEEKILQLQLRKLALANEVLTGAKRSQASKLTLDDLKILFSVH